MAINSQKLLPPSGSVGGKIVKADSLSIVDKKLVNVDKLFKNNLVLQKKQIASQKKVIENEKREKNETKLERKKETNKFKFKAPSLPRTGFLDAIQNFISYTFLGYLIGNYYEYLPKLLQFSKNIIPAINLIKNIVVSTFEGTVALIDFGYKANDEIKKFVKSIGGQDAEKTFTKFTSDFKDLINRVMTLGLYNPAPIPAKSNGGFVTKMQSGGNVMRGGKPISRAITRKIRKEPPKIKPQLTKPGKDIGGKDKIKTLFFDPSEGPSPNLKIRSPLRSLKTTSQTLKQIPLLGGIMGAAVDMAMGQRPDRNVYSSFGNAIGTLIQNAIDNQSSLSSRDIARTVYAMASGGSVPFSGRDEIGYQIGSEISSLLGNLVNARVNEIFSKINQELTLMTPGAAESGQMGQTQPGFMAPGSVPGGQLTVEQLVGLAKGAGFSDEEAVTMAAIALAESGGGSSKINNNPNTGDLSYGLWQINMIGNLGPERRKLFGISNNEQLLDPVTNAKAAFAIRKRQGFSAWSVYKSGTYKGFLAKAQSAKGAPSLATSPIVGGKGYDGYITGDPSHPNYRSDHGGSNYHDHLSFKDRATAERAYKFFKSKGFVVTEFKGYDRVGRHSQGSLHYSGLAFDIPGSQVPVGQERNLSSRVRAALSQFKALAHGGRITNPTMALIGEKGPEYVFDADTTRGLDQLAPGLLNRLNVAKTRKQLDGILQSYADYESGGKEIVFVLKEKIIQVSNPSPVSF